MRHLSPFLFMAFLLLLQSCKDEDLKATVPAYLKIDDIEVFTTKGEQGSSNDKITDAWVFVGDQLIGSFELPTVVPIQQTGNVNIKIRGGVFNNGMSNNRVIYPFYEFYVLDTTLSPQQELSLKPRVTYKTDAVFDYPWSGEDFESGVNFINHPNSDVPLSKNITTDVFEGTASGIARLNESQTFFEAYTPAFSDISRLGISAYLELNYKCTHDVVISIYTNNRQNQFSVLVLRNRLEWNKIYIDFTPVFSTLFNAQDYNIAIGYQKPIGQIGELHLDNIKFVHY